MRQILEQGERLYYKTNSASRRQRIADIVNRYGDNTARVNGYKDGMSVLNSYSHGDNNVLDSTTATRRQRMGLANG